MYIGNKYTSDIRVYTINIWYVEVKGVVQMWIIELRTSLYIKTDIYCERYAVYIVRLYTLRNPYNLRIYAHLNAF